MPFSFIAAAVAADFEMVFLKSSFLMKPQKKENVNPVEQIPINEKLPKATGYFQGWLRRNFTAKKQLEWTTCGLFRMMLVPRSTC